jgi:FkbM family methyltransferase
MKAETSLRTKPGPQRTPVQRALALRSAIGTRATIEYALQQRLFKRLGRSAKGRTVVLHPRALEHPIRARFGSSDLDVFEQIFVEREFSEFADVEAPELIVDCGAYVGYSGIFLLNLFPKAHLIAIEPDEGNFSLLRRNLEPYRNRTTLINAAVWWCDTTLVISKGTYRDGREWAVQVRDPSPGEMGSVETVEIGSVLAKSKFSRIDILKMDIEGAEAAVFAHDCSAWLGRVRNVAIELHDQHCKDVFFQSLSGYRYDLSSSGELTICKNIVRK